MEPARPPAEGQRDRDATGRPHNERPRDALGRPLPRDATGVDHGIDVDAPRSADEALTVAQALIDDGFPFAAHEVLEARWKSCPAGERELWQGLAQTCVGLTHLVRGNRPGAERVLARARLTLAEASQRHTFGGTALDPSATIDWIDAVLALPSTADSVPPLVLAHPE